MNVAEIFVRRPVLAVVVSLLILLMGLQGAISLSVRQYPKVDETVITINTAYPGANGELIQGFITTPIAKAVASVEDVDYVTSSSAQSLSTVTVRMRLGVSPDKALTEVLAKVQTVKEELPRDAEDPVISKGRGLNMPLLFLAFWSQEMNPQQISEYLRRVVAPKLATIPGVANAQIMGASEFAMRVWLDPMRMAAHNVTAAEIANAVRNSNFLAAPGKVQSEFYAYSVQTDTTLKSPESFGLLPVRGVGADVVRLRDVAKIELGPQNYEQRVVLESGVGVFIGIFGTPSANPLEVADAVKKMYPDIARSLPSGLHGRVNFDSSEPIQASIIEVFKTMSEAVLVVILVIMLFLGSFRAVVIPTVTIPLSLIGVCFVLYALGYSINLLTLLAMVLAIGLVVDDAIVVVENVHRHLDMGQKPADAAISAMKEIFGPIVAMTATLAAVYAPIGFVQGLTGTLFREFAFALAGAVIISGVIAVTLSPMMSARLLASEARNKSKALSDFSEKVERTFANLALKYRALLAQALGMKKSVARFSALVIATSVILFLTTPSELAPAEDEGFIMSFINAPGYATADYTENVVRWIGKSLGKVEDTKTTFAVVGVMGPSNSALRNYVLKPWGERHRSQAEITSQIRNGMQGVTGANVAVFTPSTLPGTSDGYPIQYVLRTVGSPEQVYDIAEKVRQKALATGKFFVMQNSMSYDTPHARVLIDRERAATLGVAIADIGTTLNTLLSENWISRFDQENRSYQIIPQVNPKDRFSPEKLNGFYVRSDSGAMVPLSALVRIETIAGPQAIEQFNQLNSATLEGVPAAGTSLNDGIKILRDIAKNVAPAGFFYDVIGEARVAEQSGNSLAFTFVFAILVIYLVLAAQFESFRDPLIIMTAVPLSIFGALIPLNLLSFFFGLPMQYSGASLNIYTELGLITLVGLIAKHGILIVQFANDRRKSGVSVEEAVLDAAQVRLRPILMTTAAMVMGVVPLLVASGAGAASRQAMGLVIASGMSIGTLFTLFVLPVFYVVLSRKTVAVAKPAEGPRPLIAKAPEKILGPDEAFPGPRRRAL